MRILFGCALDRRAAQNFDAIAEAGATEADSPQSAVNVDVAEHAPGRLRHIALCKPDLECRGFFGPSAGAVAGIGTRFRRIVVQVPEDLVHQVGPDTKHQPAAGLRAGSPAGRQGANADGARDRAYLTYWACLRQLAHLLPGRDVSAGIARHETHAESRCRFFQFDGFLPDSADRLLGQDVLFGLKGDESAFLQGVMRCGDEDGVHLRVLEQLLHRRIHDRHPADSGQPCGSGLIWIGAGGHLQVVTPDIGLCQDAALTAAADDPNALPSLILHNGPPGRQI